MDLPLATLALRLVVAGVAPVAAAPTVAAIAPVATVAAGVGAGSGDRDLVVADAAGAGAEPDQGRADFGGDFDRVDLAGDQRHRSLFAGEARFAGDRLADRFRFDSGRLVDQSDGVGGVRSQGQQGPGRELTLEAQRPAASEPAGLPAVPTVLLSELGYVHVHPSAELP